MVPNGQKRSTVVQNYLKWSIMIKSGHQLSNMFQTGPKRSKWSIIVQNGAQEWSKLSKWLEIVQMVQMVKYGPTPSNLVQYDQKWSKMVLHSPILCKRIQNTPKCKHCQNFIL